MNRKGSLVAILAVAGLLLVIGCKDDRVFIDKSFLQTMKASPTFRGWEQHEDEMLYLVSKGDKEAIPVAIKIIPVVMKADVVTKIDWLATALWDNITLNDISTLPVQQQVQFLVLYDKIQPVDWETAKAEYLAAHSDVASAYRDAVSEMEQHAPPSVSK